MIVSFEGLMGSGKSLTSTALAHSEYELNHRKVISNNHLNFPYTFFDLKYFLDHLEDEELNDCVLLLDESYLYLDGRTSSTKLNKLFTYFVVQTRKRGVDMYICIHHIDMIDKRLRRSINVRGTCRYWKEQPCKQCEGTGVFKEATCDRCLGYGETGWATTRFLDLGSGRRTRIRIFGPAVWPLYSTEELVPFSKRQMNISVGEL